MPEALIFYFLNPLLIKTFHPLNREASYLKDPNRALFKPSPNILPSKRPEIQAGGKNFFNRQTAQWKFQIEHTSLMTMGENKEVFGFKPNIHFLNEFAFIRSCFLNCLLMQKIWVH
ncbi:hypothetical protein CDAR_475851 [Caerostris darwini]|uniref:Uncharacterized protein n=1 Tax=Caerostris darwini TaxID=1538125 RepID=A0AAV4PBN9_9ARAC|nr:hypothetical protein CDAR_475851 [Caerostris darwini]